MDEKRLRDLLAAIADEAMAEGTNTKGEAMNLWPAIQAEIEKTGARRARATLGLGRIAVALLAFVMVSTAGYALYLNSLTGGGDPGIIGVGEAELTTPLNLTQTVGEVNVTLLWGYADGNRISVGYQVEHDAALLPPAMITGTLRTADGSVIPPAGYLGGGGGSGGGGDGRVISGSTLSFDATGIDSATESLDLTLGLRFDAAPNMPNAGASGQGGGGGGGGGTPGTPIAPFEVEFAFALPFIPAREIAEPQTAEAGGIAVEITSARIAPSVALLDLCFDQPESDASNWSPRFAIDGLTQSAGFTANPARTTPERVCGQAVLTALLLPVPETDDAPATLALTIDRLHSEPVMDRDRIERFADALREAGLDPQIEIMTNSQGGLSFSLSLNELGGAAGDNTRRLVDQAYDDTLREFVAGPWEFALPLR